MNTGQVPPIQAATPHAGYAHPYYAASFKEFGSPLHLPGSNGWLLQRGISGTGWTDAMGCYPLFSCRDWDAIAGDLDDLEGRLVAVSLVSDPFAPVDQARLARAFSLVIPFKRHFVCDLSVPVERAVSKHHRQCARKALQQVEVSVKDDPGEFLDSWVRLYDVLSSKHHISGIRRFSRASFEKQLQVPGTVMLAATQGTDVVGATWWFVQGDIVYEHLAAFSEIGYRLMASYALVSAAIDLFREKASWLHLGAAAGLDGDAEDGLSFFKKGWATGTRTAYLCGRILNSSVYESLAAERGATPYFPAYRAGEFG